ncbi:MAG: 2-amino-4-hydroxy-6-hydroxymethyldihydropteridine diphosphokinase [Hymenobacter sp.]
MKTTEAYLLLGSNLGDRADRLAQARADLAGAAGRVTAASALYETAAWGVADQPDFLNQVAGPRNFPGWPYSAGRLPGRRAAAGPHAAGALGARTLDVDVLLLGRSIATPRSPCRTRRCPSGALPWCRWPSWPRS